MKIWKPYFFALIAFASIAACGGSTSDDGANGGKSSGGTSSGGTSSGGKSSGGSPSGGTAAGGGGTGACPSDQVPTIDGCLTCDAATLAYSNASDAAQKANSACNLETDCVLTAASTTCSGACPIAVSKSGEAAFQSELADIDKNYCSGFVAVCGYSTPKCANAKLACNAGSCEAVF